MMSITALPEKKVSSSQPSSLQQQQQQHIITTDNNEPPELTFRSLVGGIMIGSMLCFSNMYFGLQTGWVTMGSLQSALLGFGLFKTIGETHFTAKENVVLQTTAVAASAMPLAGGFVGIIPALKMLSLEKFTTTFSSLQKLYAWCLALGFFGVFMVPPLRKQTILREQLPFPSGTATAEIIRQLHRLPKKKEENHKNNSERNNDIERNNNNDENQRRKEKSLLIDNETKPLLSIKKEAEGDEKYNNNLNTMETASVSAPAWRLLFLSFAFSSLYTLIGNFIPIIRNIPLGSYIGIPALTAWSWTIQPSPSYFGQGLIMGPKTSVSMLFGTIIGWGILAPMARTKGWANGPIQDAGTGARGWLLWVSLAIMLADSAISLGLILMKFLFQSNNEQQRQELDPAPPHQQITWKMWLPGLLGASVLCTVILAPMFDMPLYQPTLAVLFSLLVAVLAIRALGETDLNPVSGIGKVSQLLFAIIAPGNVVANLVAGAIAEAGATSAGEMMQDLKTGHLLKASPRAQFIAQLVGTTVSCVVVVSAWNLYSSTYEIPGPEFPAPSALIWLDMAKVVSEGEESLLSMNVIPVAMSAAAITVLLLIVEASTNCNTMILPSPMAAAIGMYVTPNWTLPRVVGGLTNYVWYRLYHDNADKYMIVLASGFVFGEGLTSIINALLKSMGVTWVWCGGCLNDGFCPECP